jgi:8-oxo-dGTP pyrophosphatase MutT (NUDIX family)
MNKIIIASGSVIVEDGKVLLSKHGDTTFWKFCGGRVEHFDQSLQEAAAREAKEEAGIDVEFTKDDPFFSLHHKKD